MEPHHFIQLWLTTKFHIDLVRFLYSGTILDVPGGYLVAGFGFGLSSPGTAMGVSDLRIREWMN